MKSRYKQAMDTINLSPGATARIRYKLRHPVKTVRLRPAAVLVAAVLVLVLGTTAAASGVFYHDIPAAIAQSLEPIQLSSTSQGITMTVQSASVEDGVLTAYITMEDLEGDRLRDGVDLYDSFHINTPYRTAIVISGWRPLGFDEESGTYGHLVTVQPKDSSGKKLNFEGKHFTFSINQLLLGQTKTTPALTMDWSALPETPATVRKYIYGLNHAADEKLPLFDDGTALLLQPGTVNVPVTDGVTISAAGFLDGKFRLQLQFDNLGPDDHGWLALVGPNGEQIAACGSMSTREEDGTKYQETLYGITPEELANCTLTGEFTTGGYLLDGDWKVTFTLFCEE